MIDKRAIACSGYRSFDRRNFSISVDGYYPNNVIDIIPLPPERLLGNSGKRKKDLYLQDDEDLAYILSIFVKKWV